MTKTKQNSVLEFFKQNLNNVLRQLGPLPFAALGMTFVIIAGFIDLSIVGIISLVGVITVGLIDPLGQGGALLVGILLGAFLGWLNGLVLTTCGAMTQAEVLFITYGMSSIYMALALIYTQSETLRLAKSEKSYSIFTTLGSKNLGIIRTRLIWLDLM